MYDATTHLDLDTKNCTYRQRCIPERGGREPEKT